MSIRSLWVETDDFPAYARHLRSPHPSKDCRQRLTPFFFFWQRPPRLISFFLADTFATYPFLRGSHRDLPNFLADTATTYPIFLADTVATYPVFLADAAGLVEVARPGEAQGAALEVSVRKHVRQAERVVILLCGGEAGT